VSTSIHTLIPDAENLLAPPLVTRYLTFAEVLELHQSGLNGHGFPGLAILSTPERVQKLSIGQHGYSIDYAGTRFQADT